MAKGQAARRQDGSSGGDAPMIPPAAVTLSTPPRWSKTLSEPETTQYTPSPTSSSLKRNCATRGERLRAAAVPHASTQPAPPLPAGPLHLRLLDYAGDQQLGEGRPALQVRPVEEVDGAERVQGQAVENLEPGPG